MDELTNRVAEALQGVDEAHALTAGDIASRLGEPILPVTFALRLLVDTGFAWTDDHWGWYALPDAPDRR